MKGKNTTNFRFLKDFRPELYKLAVRMEADLLVTPVSMLAYATRFMEYILYDIAKRNNYGVNRESGFVNNIYELIQQDFIEYSFGDLLIKAYHFRNTSIHNTDITKSLKEDRNTAFELNRRLFDIADIYYKTVTNNYEEHEYAEPKRPESPKGKFPSTVTKQEKHFDTCIICGESTVRTKSNFCTECDNLLNYREALAKVITEKGWPRLTVYIKNSEHNEDVENIIGAIQAYVDNEVPSIMAFSRDGMELVPQKKIIRLYVADRKVCIETEDRKYEVRKSLQEIETDLDKSRFIRISQSETINISKVKRFDFSSAGTIGVEFCNGQSTWVARRRVRDVKRLLGCSHD